MLESKLERQNGFCYYSKMKMSYESHTHWLISLERLDPNEGYTDENTVLCAMEFNSSNQWTKELFQQWINLMFSRNVSETTLVPLQNSKTLSHKSWTRCKASRTNALGQLEQMCRYCDTYHSLDHFLLSRGNIVHHQKGCANCTNTNPYIGILGIIERAKSTTSTHESKFKIERAKAVAEGRLDSFDKRIFECDIDEAYLIDLFNSQQELCAYSNIPLKLVFNSYSHEFAASLDRINTKLGYIKGNVCLIWKYLNCRDNSCKLEDTLEREQLGFSKSKVECILEANRDLILSNSE